MVCDSRLVCAVAIIARLSAYVECLGACNVETFGLKWCFNTPCKGFYYVFSS